MKLFVSLTLPFDLTLSLRVDHFEVIAGKVSFVQRIFRRSGKFLRTKKLEISLQLTINLYTYSTQIRINIYVF